MTRLPCGCGIAWLTTGGPQEPANVRAPPVFRRHSANERPGWLLCEAHRMSMGIRPVTRAAPAQPETLQDGIARVWASWGLRSPLHGILS